MTGVGILLDTNVISELTRPKPAPPVIAFLAAQEDLWLSTLVLHELEFGMLLLPSGGRRDALRGILSELVRRYEDRVIAVDTEAATWAARFRVDARRGGCTLDLGDALIAGTAKARGLAVATRNVTDFRGLDLVVANPWDFG